VTPRPARPEECARVDTGSPSELVQLLTPEG